jgi:hypothetical protein
MIEALINYPWIDPNPLMEIENFMDINELEEKEYEEENR